MKIKDIVDAVQHGVDLLKGEETIDKTYCSQNSFRDEPTALEAYRKAREKIFDVNRWSGLSAITANFVLHDPTGHSKPDGRPEVGDYIRVELPGPAPENWIQVIEVEDEERKAGFTARPSTDPREKNGPTEHFFTEASTSTFRVSLVGLTVFACQIGENERANNQNPEAGDRSAINTMIAGAGWLFYQKIQWKILLDYVVAL